ncbi:MAG: 16S rRNA (cytosine(1402)-N(4))-methyltransferase RsmH [Chitinophagaceae bacterium]|nr:16S rRNA (cytosine(1402)-N(4))-methyltransferase RsmH [Chitinophagaceae bacterium]
MANNNYHIPVLLQETITALNINPAGTYVDCTFGGGGHSKHILEQLNEKGKLVAFDQDEDAKKNLLNDERFLFVPHNFRHLQRFLRLYKIDKIDGILADLGVSSHQFDEGSRGFSTRFDGPFDMRMNVQQELTAKQIVSTYTAQQLQWIFQEYGQVTNAKTLATHIVQHRNTVQFETIAQFKTFISAYVKGNPNKYLAQVFQALRIEVNDEVGALKEMLLQLPNVLNKGARVAIITFHSLEDRLVKNYFRNEGFEVEVDINPFSTTVKEKRFGSVSKKPIEASEKELKLNNRSRSAKLRVADFLG